MRLGQPIVESLEGRQLLSVTHVADRPSVKKAAPPPATVKLLVQSSTHVRSVKATRVIATDDPFLGTFNGDLSSPADGTFSNCQIQIASTDGHGNYFGSIAEAKVDPQTEQVGPSTRRDVQFKINAAGDLSMITVSAGQIAILKGRVVDGTIQGTYRTVSRFGSVVRQVYTGRNFGLG